LVAWLLVLQEEIWREPMTNTRNTVSYGDQGSSLGAWLGNDGRLPRELDIQTKERTRTEKEKGEVSRSHMGVETVMFVLLFSVM
jgi:hypothetical protein